MGRPNLAAGEMRILVVEDEYLIRLTLAEALADEGFDVIEAADGNEAMAAVRGEPDLRLLLTDVQLPGPMNGQQLALAARGVNPHLPVIFMTGRPEPLDIRLQAERNLVISKPYLPSEICAAARQMLDDADPSIGSI